MTQRTHYKGNKTPIIKTGTLTLLFWWFAELAAWLFVGAVACTIFGIALEPWQEGALFLIGKESPLPFIGWLFRLPLIGESLRFLASNPIQWVASVLMVVFNILQALFILLELGHLKNLKKAWVQRIKVGAIFAWIIELCIALIEHPIYAGGMSAFLSDANPFAFAVRPQYFIFGEIVSAAILLGLFEGFVYFSMLVVFMLRNNASRCKAQAKAQSTEVAS